MKRFSRARSRSMPSIPRAHATLKYFPTGPLTAPSSSRCFRPSIGARLANWRPCAASWQRKNSPQRRREHRGLCSLRLCVSRCRDARNCRMGKITGFMEYQRLAEPHEPKEARKKHYREFYARLSDEAAATQGARCMDCGIPFCMSGCPVNNIIPDWNDLVYRQDWKAAIETLHSTNNFPEFTGRICPAPCEEACVLRINEDAVGIKSIEHAIIDKAWEEGWVRAQPAPHRTGKKVAVVGSGPAGLASAQQLERAGHDVTVFEKSDRIGGLLRYGIPDFKLEKGVIDRRLEQMRAEGVKFRAGVFIGSQPPGPGVISDAKASLSPKDLLAEFDAVVLAAGA